MLLVFKGLIYPNNSIIPITEIGADSQAALQCIYERTSIFRVPVWYFPNGSTVSSSDNRNFYAERVRIGNNRTNLFRQNREVFDPVGSFCCNLRHLLFYSSNAIMTVCAVIGEEYFYT